MTTTQSPIALHVGCHSPSNQAAIDLLFDLVSTPSVSGSEQTAARMFVARAIDWGFAANIDEVGNAVAIRQGTTGDAPVREIVLLGHIDTVGGTIHARIEQDVLHGRGSVDAKGPLCAMLVAAARAHLPAGVRLRIAGAVGEETSISPGARFLAAHLRPDACIIGEPSNVDGVTLGYKGRLIVTLHASQECGHSAGPNGSASDAVLRAWNACTAICEQLESTREPPVSGAIATIQRTAQAMSSSSDGLLAHATLVGGFRLPVWIDPNELETALASATRNLGVTASFHGHERAHASDRNDLVARSLATAVRDHGMRPRPTLKTGTSDMNVVAPIWRCPIAAYGPGDSSLDHTPHERIVLADYLKTIDVLTHAIELIAAELLSPP